eukprot:TRINITY_DN78500_c0_g1_i1.p1 TRINITY_DN78500_c0_g1~~TRINITY_DN78500_c0_g1_i1.p1  ORF type:complete len:161 (+),score=20.95 TRINITY_DN78500_c0_g1_i1:50-532(+)
MTPLLALALALGAGAMDGSESCGDGISALQLQPGSNYSEMELDYSEMQLEMVSDHSEMDLESSSHHKMKGPCKENETTTSTGTSTRTCKDVPGCCDDGRFKLKGAGTPAGQRLICGETHTGLVAPAEAPYQYNPVYQKLHIHVDLHSSKTKSCKGWRQKS